MAHTWQASFPEIIESKNFQIYLISLLLLISFECCKLSTLNEKKSSHMDECAVQQWEKNEIYIRRKNSSGFREDFEGINEHISTFVTMELK